MLDSLDDLLVADAGVNIENLQMIIQDVLAEESDQRCFTAASFAHNDHWHHGLNPQINDAHLQEVVGRHHIVII